MRASSARQHHGYRFTAIGVDGIMSTNGHFINHFSNFYVGQTARKGLFIHMRVVKRSGTQHRTVRCQHLPFVYIVIPPRIIVAHRHIEIKGFICGPSHLDTNNICFTGKNHCR